MRPRRRRRTFLDRPSRRRCRAFLSRARKLPKRRRRQSQIRNSRNRLCPWALAEAPAFFLPARERPSFLWRPFPCFLPCRRNFPQRRSNQARRRRRRFRSRGRRRLCRKRKFRRRLRLPAPLPAPAQEAWAFRACQEQSPGCRLCRGLCLESEREPLFRRARREGLFRCLI